MQEEMWKDFSNTEEECYKPERSTKPLKRKRRAVTPNKHNVIKKACK
jgi:hypothetical protein